MYLLGTKHLLWLKTIWSRLLERVRRLWKALFVTVSKPHKHRFTTPSKSSTSKRSPTWQRGQQWRLMINWLHWPLKDQCLVGFLSSLNVSREYPYVRSFSILSVPFHGLLVFLMVQWWKQWNPNCWVSSAIFVLSFLTNSYQCQLRSIILIKEWLFSCFAHSPIFNCFIKFLGFIECTYG